MKDKYVKAEGMDAAEGIRVPETTAGMRNHPLSRPGI